MREFLQHKLREGIIREESKEWEYQIRYIDGPIFYKRESGQDVWQFTTAEDFALNAPDGKLVKWEGNEES